MLYRIVFDSPLGPPFSVPPAFDGFPAPLPGLPGIPTDGGFAPVDAASHSTSATGVHGFIFRTGPPNRMAAALPPAGPRARSVSPGATSAVPGAPFSALPTHPRSQPLDGHPLRLRSRAPPPA